MNNLKILATRPSQFNEPELPRFMDLIYEQIVSDIYTKREDQIKERLAIIGFRFNTLPEWHQFGKERLTIVTYEDKPQWRELYIDYGKPDQMLVATWWDTYMFMHACNDANFNHYITIVSGHKPNS